MNAPSHDARKSWMSVLARAPHGRLSDLMPHLPPHDVLRAPEVGAVMVQGRVGATGTPFNLGEMTVTRCSVRLADGGVGHAWVQGRNKDHARRAAVADALLQSPAAADIYTRIIVPLSDEAQASRALRTAKAAATKVDFFAMVRGEDT